MAHRMIWDALPEQLVFEPPERLTDVSSWHTHIPFAFWCVESTRPRVLVELGTHKGDSYSAFCQAVKRLAIPAACYAVDTWKGDHEAGFYGDEVLEELRAYHDPRYAAFSRLVRSTFDEALVHFADGSVDLLHIDGLHTYEAVRHDFESWLPKLSTRAVVLFHDVNVRELDFGAWRFWEEVSVRYPSFTFLHGHGLGVLLVGTEAPEPARRLAACQADDAAGPRALFATLGHQVEVVAKLRQATSQLELQGQQLVLRERQVEQARAERERQVEKERLQREHHVEQERAEREHQVVQARAEREREVEQERAEQKRQVEKERDSWKWSADQRETKLTDQVKALSGELRGAHEVAQDCASQSLSLAYHLHALEEERNSILSRLERLMRPLANSPLIIRPLRRPFESLWRRVVVRRIAASGLFDEAYYRASCPFMPLEANAIRHYVKRGARDGLNPHAMFDTSWYLRENPDVQRKGLNPLFHYLAEGGGAGLSPHPQFSAAQYLLAALPTATRPQIGPSTRGPVPEPVVTSVAPSASPVRLRVRSFDGASAPSTEVGPLRPRTILLCHVFPFPPRAGNEYRIHRLLRWLERSGHEVVLVVAPLPGDSVTEEQLAVAAGQQRNFVACTPDGEVRFQVTDPDLWKALEAADGLQPLAAPPPVDGLAEALHAETASIERTFCPDHLLHLLGTMVHAAPPDVFIASYVFTSRALLRLGPETLRVIDTIDVFSTKQQKVLRYGIKDDSAISTEAEASMLNRADLQVAIQSEEARELAVIAPAVSVVTVGVDFDMASAGPPPAEPVLLYVASNNPMNVRGLADFLALAWPLVRRERPGAILRVVGPVCETVVPGTDGVELLGRVHDLGPLYAAARVVINPAVAGTGLKIKTLESLANLRPIVAWPAGVEGVSSASVARCSVADDWYHFARLVLEQLAEGNAERLFAAREEIERELGPAKVYAELDRVLKQHLKRAASEGKHHE